MPEQQGISLVDAIQTAIDAERQAAAFYADAVGKTGNPMGKKLFRQLADFEGSHIRILTAFKVSLLDGGDVVVYDGGELKLPTPGDLPGSSEPSRLSVMAVLELAAEAERRASQRYRDLARWTLHPGGRAIFERLASEELGHLDLLDGAYAELNDRGEVDWLSGPPS